MIEMTVNGSSIEKYHARLLNFSVGGTERGYSQSDPRAVLRLPDIYNVTIAPRRLSITLTFFPKDGRTSGRNSSIPERLSRSTENIVFFETDIGSSVVEIGLPDGYIYKSILQAAQPASFDATGEQDVEYTFLAIRQKPRITQAVVPGGVINCHSNTVTPFRLTMKVPTVRSRITVCGIVIKSVAANTEIVIDSEQGLITSSGANKFNDTEFVDFPHLLPGNNIISCSAADAQISVSYTPIYA